MKTYHFGLFASGWFCVAAMACTLNDDVVQVVPRVPDAGRGTGTRAVSADGGTDEVEQEGGGRGEDSNVSVSMDGETDAPDEATDGGSRPMDDQVNGGTVDPGTGGSPSAQPACTSGEVMPCDTFVTPTGVEIALGPYGARMDYNVGQGFENDVTIPDVGLNLTCTLVVGVYDEAPDISDDILDTSGRCPGCPDLDFSLYTVYRPANMASEERYPVIIWGNGACVPPEGYGGPLRYAASHGFIVVAPNSRWVNDSTPLLRSLDFIVTANGDPESPYYQRIDTTRVGVMGHAQGGIGASAAASDPRIQAVILFNSVDFVEKPYLAITGDLDIGGPTVDALQTTVSEAPKAAFLFYHMVPSSMSSFPGHLTLITEPERVVEPIVGWWKYIFFDDESARALFVGPDCGFCSRDPEFTYGQNGLE